MVQGTLWPIHPKPFDGEVLSSWLTRIAQGHGMTLTSLRRACLPKLPGHLTDIDLDSDPLLFTAISELTSVNPGEIQRMGYTLDEGITFARRIRSVPEWIIPVTRDDDAPIAFCPSCLATDNVPHYRKLWRYAFAPICPVHGPMLERCPTCGKPYRLPSQTSEQDLIDGRMGRCGNCLERFPPIDAHAVSEPALTQWQGDQARILAALQSGWIHVCGRGEVHVCLYLRGLHEFVLLLLNRQRGSGIAAWIGAQSGIPPCRLRPTLRIECLPLAQRITLLAQAAWLSEDWPNRVVSLVSALGLPASLFPVKRSDLGWMSHPDIDALLGSLPYRRTDIEVAAARESLARARQWAPTITEVRTYLQTAEVPPIRPTKTPPTPEAKLLVIESAARVDAAYRLEAAERKDRRTMPQQLFSVFERHVKDIPDILSLDDASDRLSSLSERWRRRKSRPTS